MLRTLLAFIAAPLIVPIIVLGADWLLSGKPPYPGDFLGVLIWAYPVELVLGVPGWIIFRHYHVTSILSYLAAGAAIGGAVVLTLRPDGYFIPIDLLATVCSVLLFRYISVFEPAG